MTNPTREPLPEPETPLQACLTAGERAFEEHRWPDAIKWFAKAAELAPAHTEILDKLGFCLSRNKEYQRALDLYTALSAREPRVACWPYMVGYQYYALGQWAEALHWFDRALSIRPAYLIVLYRKGYAHRGLSQLEEAEQAWKSGVAAWERLPQEAQRENRKCYSDVCFQLGKLYLEQGLTLKARKYLKPAVEYDPDDVDKHYRLGDCLLKLHLPNEAIQELRQAEALHPGKDYIIDRLARASMEVGDLAEAERQYGRIPPPRRKEYVLRDIGLLFYKQGHYEEAIRNLLQAIRKEPRNHHSHHYLGLAYEAEGNLAKARQEYREAIRLRQQHYGIAYPEAEERLKAVEEQLATQQAVEVAPVIGSLPGGIQTGKIVSYNSQRGFGFIENTAGESIFFHVSALPVGLMAKEGLEVEYEVQASPKGLRAIHLLLKAREA
jgi:tetratricopeptide (TPR) repeat protein/cold shock CspA family protein